MLYWLTENRKKIIIIILCISLLFIERDNASYIGWKEIEEWAGQINASATVIKFEFISHYRNKYLAEDQFELYENILSINVYLLASTSNISIEKLVIISPSGEKRCINMSGGHYKKPILYMPVPNEINPEKPLIFNETGIWTIEIQTNSSTYISEYKGSIWDFNKNSKVNNYYGNRKGIEVLSPSAVQQLATAIETKNLVKWQRYMAIATAAMACATVLMAFATFYTKRRK